MYIFSAQALASCRWRPLSSNVRPRKHTVIYLQCTKRAQARLGLAQNNLQPAEDSKSRLGSWSLHVIPLAGRLGYLFMNDRSLLSFDIMEGKQRVELGDLLVLLETGVKNVGVLLGLPAGPLTGVLKDFEEIAIAAAPSRSISGLLSSLGTDYAECVNRATDRRGVDMSELIAAVNSKPRAKLGFATSSEVARDLLLQTSEA